MGVKERHLRRYRAALAGRPWLHLVETNVYRIPERLNEMDRDLFAVFNFKQSVFEVHDASVPIPSMTRILDAEELDGRVLERINTARHDQDPFGLAERWAREHKAAEQRRTDALAHDMARDFADVAMHAEWGQKSYKVK